MYSLRMNDLSGRTKSTDRNHPELLSVLCASLNIADLSPKLRSAKPIVSYSKVSLRKGMNSPVARINSNQQCHPAERFFLMAGFNMDLLGSKPTTSPWGPIDRESAKVTRPVP